MVKREIEIIIKSYIKQMRANNVAFDKVILFGSQVNGTAHEWSDIDVAVVSHAFGNDLFYERLRLSRIAFNVDPRLEVHPVTMDAYLNDSWTILVHEIKQSGIEIAA